MVMQLPRRKFLHLAVSAAALPAASGLAIAQTFPSRPITIIVPLPPGGAVDALARIMAEHMRGTLNQPIVVEHIGGAGGTIAGARVARAAPDGYTMGIGNWSSYVASGAAYPIQYDLLKDFEPVALLPNVPYWLVARKNLPPKDLRELVDWLKANSAKATAATTGAGSGSHICSVYFQTSTGTEFQLVPYRGGAPALQDVIGGQVDIMCDLAANSRPQVANGNVKALAVMAKTRWFAAPDVPTADELGLPGIYVSTWHGFWVPKSTPREIVMKLNGAAIAAMADTTVRQRIADLGMEIPPREQQTPEALGAFHKAEIEKWWPIIKAAGIKPE
jgi:tripartite-type tricarboxylate transporter receptor subunit TctC